MYDQNFYGGREGRGGVVHGEGWCMGRGGAWGGGVAAKDVLSGRCGSLRDLSKNILKQGVGKGKSCS